MSIFGQRILSVARAVDVNVFARLFVGDAEVLSYFYGPIGILLMMNLTLFAATARELTCGLWRTEVVKSTSER